MKHQLIVPQIGESISEAQLSRWLIADGEITDKDQDVAEIDSDKTTLTISAPAAGRIQFLVSEGDMVKIGQLIAEIDTSVAFEQKKVSADKQESTHETPPSTEKIIDPNETHKKKQTPLPEGISISPLAKKRIELESLNTNEIIAYIAKPRIGVNDIENFLKKNNYRSNSERTMKRSPMSPLRKKIAQRLVAVKNQTAMLTTFNEIDMSKLIEIRKKHQDDFQAKYGIKLGFMSFFTKACAIALKKHPPVNAIIDNEEIVYYNYCDISIAVSTEKGLVVPVIRNVDTQNIPQIEQSIAEMAEKARTYKLIPEDFEGGTFTITNGGVFGSLLSTPIINPPQTAILGMHTIQERPVAVQGKVEIRPMMYIALSYDHRLIDGKESVSFVMEVKRLLENPENFFTEKIDTFNDLLGLHK